MKEAIAQLFSFGLGHCKKSIGLSFLGKKVENRLDRKYSRGERTNSETTLTITQSSNSDTSVGISQDNELTRYVVFDGFCFLLIVKLGSSKYTSV